MPIQLTLDREVKDFLDEYKKETGVPASQLIDRLVRQFMINKKTSDV